MDLIRKGIGLTKTIRNVGRLREIVSVFAKNGFDEFITRGVVSKIPNFVLPKSKIKIKEELATQSERDWGKIIGHRLRKCFEELGPTFIKLGQLLSSREDIFDSSFIDEMKYLRDKVKGVPFSKIQEEIETSLGCPISEVFKELESEPIGTASISVVHKGILKNGREVVVKVQRPDIAKMIEVDFSIISFLIGKVEKVSDDIKFLGLSRIFNEFSLGLQSELNFYVEALNCQRLKKNLAKHDREGIFYIPCIYDEYTTKKILVMEFFEGIPFSDRERIDQHTEILHKKLKLGLELFIKSFLQDGFFHADLHGGNFFLLKSHKIGVVDFGLMGTLSKKGRQNFIAILYALLTNNYENLVYEFLDIADYQKIPDVDQMVYDVRQAIAPFVGLTAQQINFSQLLQAVIQALFRHQVFLPREWFIVFRAMITLDGVGRSIGLDFDIFGPLERDIKGIVRGAINKEDLIEEGVWVGKDILASARVLPRHLKWFIQDWAKNNYRFRISHSGHEKSARQIAHAIQFLGLCIVSSIFIISGVLLMGPEQGQDLGRQTLRQFMTFPGWTGVFWGIALAFLVRGVFLLRK